LREVYEIADRVVILRNGERVADEAVDHLPIEHAVGLMGGGAKSPALLREKTRPGKAAESALLTVTRLTGKKFSDVSFEIRRGDIVGMTGLVGSGRTEIAEAVIGATRPASGAIVLDGQPKRFASPTDALQAGIAFVPEVRRDAVFYGQTVEFNIAAGMWGRASRGVTRPSRAEATSAVSALIAKMAIKSSGRAARASMLSGGNQQKAILGRALASKPRLLVLDEPTHGIDVGAKQEIHALIRRLAAEGLAVWFISSEVEEVAELATRAIVIHGGKIVGEAEAPLSVAGLVALSFESPERRDGV
jgi:ABC-type sugar transport system ATPase subunit